MTDRSDLDIRTDAKSSHSLPKQIVLAEAHPRWVSNGVFTDDLALFAAWKWFSRSM